MRLNLSVKITLLALAFTTVGVACVVYQGFKSVDTMLQEQTVQTVTRELRQQGALVVEGLRVLRQDALVLARSESFDHLPVEKLSTKQNDDLTHFYSIATFFLEQHPAYLQIRMIDPASNDRNLANIHRNPNQSTHQTLPKKLFDHWRSRDYRKNLASKAEAYRFSAVEFSQNYGGVTQPEPPILSIFVPVFGEQDQLAGIIAIHANFNLLTRPLASPPAHMNHFLADSRGDYLFHSDTKRRYPARLSQTGPLFLDYPQVSFTPASEPSDVGLSAIKVVYLSKNKEVLAFSRIYFDPLDSERWFTIGVVAANSSIEEKSWDYWSKTLEMAFFAVMTLGLVIVFAARTMTVPIKRLTQTAIRIASGEANVNAEPMSQDEVGELAVAFQAMVEKLRYSNMALRDLADSLEEQVKQRTADLAIARDQALEAHRAQTVFLATMSHEIRTPLNVVLGILELLQESPLESHYQEQVSLAFGSGRNLLVLINNVLDFSKIDAGQFTLDEVDFDIVDLVDEVALTLAPLAHAKEIELTALYPQTAPPAVRGDMVRLRQIFINLVGNAIKFTPEKGFIEIHGGPVGRINKRLELYFEIRDSGIGIDPGQCDRIFEPFVQTDNSSTRRHEGTGLGLAICKHLVQRMGGEIGFFPNPETPSGSIFYFNVILDEQTKVATSNQVQASLQGVRVLGVETNDLQTRLLHDLLILRGAQFDHVDDVSRVPDYLATTANEDHSCQIIIFNQKPGEKNRDVFHSLHHTTINLNFIILTDLLDQSWDEASDLPGAAICVKKPVNAERILSAIDWLQGTQASLQSTSPKKQKKVIQGYVGSILLVDDQLANRKVAHSMLSCLGCDADNIVTAINGLDAVERFKNGTFHFILMDCQMPVMNGFDACTSIRAWENDHHLPRVPIIAFTADVTPDCQERIEQSGMDGFLIKPVSLLDFREKLDLYLPSGPTTFPATINARVDAQEEALSSERSQANTVDITAVLKSMESIGLPEEDFREVAELLTTQLPELLGSLEKDLREGNYESARATSHVLKGSMANTIFPQLQEPSKILHERIKAQKWHQVSPVLGNLKTKFSVIKLALDEYLRRTA